METLLQKSVLEKKRIVLNGRRRFQHYFDALIVGGISIVILSLLLKDIVNRNEFSYSPVLVTFLIFPALAIFLFIKQYKSLYLKELKTNNSKLENYNLVKETLRSLQWKIKVDNKGFIEAYVDSFILWTWQEELFTILITDNRILFNSISSVDDFATQSITWGQNKRNMKLFLETFELISRQHKS